MTIEEIQALPVSELADKDCALFMWITFPLLKESLSVLSAWGFKFKTIAFVWIKQNRKSDSLFASEKTIGWDVWGNEVESDIILGGTDDDSKAKG